MCQSQALGNTRTDIPTCGGKAGIAESLRHQTRPQLGGFDQRHATNGGTVGEAESRQRRHDDIKRVRRVASMTPWIGQQRDDFDHFKEGAGPAVGDDNREWVGSPSVFVNEVDAEAIDLGAKVCELIECGLLRSPIETMLPVCQERLEIVEVRPILPASSLNLIGPSGTC